MAQIDSLSSKQRKAIVSLLSQRTIEDAAKFSGISSRTIYRWMVSDVFRIALLDAEGQAVDQATRRLIGGKDTALDTLADLMLKAESESVRRQAASDWLAHLIKMRELRNIENRLTALEAAFNGQH
jgi:DNA-directed RNA polymerase specialized sigma24 family protein